MKYTRAPRARTHKCVAIHRALHAAQIEENTHLWVRARSARVCGVHFIKGLTQYVLCFQIIMESAPYDNCHGELTAHKQAVHPTPYYYLGTTCARSAHGIKEVGA